MKKGDMDSPTTTATASTTMMTMTTADSSKEGDVDPASVHKHMSKSVVSRYFVKKHTWMSKTYRRLFLTNIGELLLVSATSTEITDRWRYENIVSVNPDPKNPEDFSIVVRKDDKSDKTEKITFSATLRPYLLTELLQFISQTSPEKRKEMTLNETYLNKVRRNGKRKRVLFSIMPWGICQVEHGAVVRTYFFHLLNRILTVSDKPGAFVLEYGKMGKQRYLFDLRREELMILITTIRSAAENYISEAILDGKTTMKQAEEDAVCCKEVLNPFNTLEEFRMFKVNKVRHADPSVRIVSLTKNWIVERMTLTDRVVSLHRLSYVDRVLINTSTPGGFTIFYKNDTKGVYTCDNDSVRDSFITYLLDCASSIGVQHIAVSTVGPNRSFCTLPPGVPVDSGTEEQFLTVIATWDANTRVDEFMNVLSKFNANIPYGGPKHITEAPKLEKLAVKALETILRMSTPSCATAQTFAALYRLLVIPIVFNTFIDTKPLQNKLLSLIKPILSTQNYDSVLIYNMINVIHLLVAPQLHMEFDKVEEFATNNGYDEIGIIEKAIADVNRKESPFDSTGQLTLTPSSSNASSTHGSAVYDDIDSVNGSEHNTNRDLVTLDNVLADSASNEFIDHMSEIKYFREEGKTILMEDDVLIQLFLTHLMSCVFRDSASLMVLGWINVFSALIFSDPKRTEAENEMNNSLLDKMGMLGRGFFKLFSQTYCPSITRNSLAILNLILKRENSKLAESIKSKALSDGATLQYFRAFLYPDVTNVKTIIMSVVKRQLFRILVTGCDPGLGMIKRIVPPGLAYFLTSPDVSTNANANGDTLPQPRTKNDTDRRLIFGMKFLNRWNRNIVDSLNGSKKLQPGELNWNRFYEEFQCDHVEPDLVWNSGTRQELKAALDEEITIFRREQSVLRNKCITWNHAEFTVKYKSLEREVRVGGYYLQLLLDGKKVNTVRDPIELYDLLFRRVLVERNTELQALCVQALTTVYMCFKDKIGPFKDVEHMVTLLQYCNDYLVRDRLVQLFQVITSASTANAYAFTKSKGIPLLVDLLTLSHFGTSKKIPSLSSSSSGLADEVERDVPKEWYYSNRGNAYPHASYKPGDESGGPMTIDELRKLYRTGVVTPHTLMWAQGMMDWEPLENVLPARWALMGTGQRILNDEELCESIIDIFTTLCEAFPTKDEAGILIRPVSKPKQQLTSAKVLPHLVQLLLVRNGPITNKVVTLLSILLYENPQAISQLYRTGFFYFAISQNSRNLEYLFDLFKLVKLLHRRQAATSARAVFANEGSSSSSSSSLSSERKKKGGSSIYNGILPEGLVCYLDLLSPEMYISVIMGVEQSITPIKIVWDDDMRKTLTRSIKKHLGDFPRRLAENPKAVYQYKPMAPVAYARSKNLDAPGYRIDDVFCYHYYVNRIKIPEKFVMYSNENPLDFIGELDSLLPNVQNYPNDTELRNIIVRLQAYLYRKYYKLLHTPQYAHYETLAEVLSTTPPSDPVVPAAVAVVGNTTQYSAANMIAAESSGCLAAIMNVFVALGTGEPRKLSSSEESVLRRTLRILCFVAEKPKYAGVVERYITGITRTMFKVLHAYNFEESYEVSDESVKSILLCMFKLIPKKAFACEFVTGRLFYEVVPILFKCSLHTPNFVSIGDVKDPEKDVTQLAYDALKTITKYTMGDGDAQLTVDYQTKAGTRQEDIFNTFKMQMFSLFTNSILENLKLDNSKEFFLELASMDRNAMLEKIKTLESQYN